ncbi:NAD-dependent oxidoreductase [Granulibacter bethesdensis]|uniref:NAD-dependent oxidoreductase n=1 Tax=Granulibacter bethesdensis TaxID=364410 RepID=A0AAN0REC3_9PROT|nr:Gfo/Idh/MocA family oxidoreductase [Granulibacter bethesdensis]AHJ63336.1 NAD-dependent oxidoreductase [Granulibacter bethesdensis]AHJ66090.1 NAD-dependent oxidoreductase [Granulibacter bethesdensis CGDNIH4]
MSQTHDTLPSGSTLRIGLAGAGHFGRFHALKIASSRRAVLAGIFDPDETRALALAKETKTVALGFDALLAQCDAIVIAAPAEVHFVLAERALEAGLHVLIEKPIAATLEQADRLAALAEEKRRVLQVGHLVRYSAEYAAVANRMERPLYIEATRIAPFKPRGTDVSVILDLMIHDLDLVLALVDSPILSVDAVGAPVAGPHEDIANARLRFENGAVATITASRISLKTERKMRLFAQNGYMSVNFMDRKLMMIGRDRGLPIPGGQGARIEETGWKDHDALAAEHEAFAASILDGAPILVNAYAGRRALAAALAVAESMNDTRARLEASGLIRHEG